MIEGASRDTFLIFAARAVRMFCYGFLSVMLGVYLKDAGFGLLFIGALFTTAVASSAALTLGVSAFADRIGRRSALGLCAGLLGLSGLLFLLTQHPLLLFLAMLSGTMSISGENAGAFVSIEQALLPQTSPEEQRTRVFGLYNTFGTLAGAAGALFSSLPDVLGRWLGVAGLLRYKPMFLIQIVGAGFLAVFYSRLSRRVELTRQEETLRGASPEAKRIMVKLSLLFGLDALAGGFVLESIIALWFHLRFGVSLELLAGIFFVSGLLSALSFLAATWLAQRIGLVNTMVFTHLPSNLLLMAVPLAPGRELAMLLFLLRQSLSQMDVPTRQSYTMGVVKQEERTAVAGITNVSRSFARAVSPALSGYALQFLSLSTPFFLGGGLKVLYDLALFFTFRRLRAPEEVLRMRQGNPANAAGSTPLKSESGE